MAVCAAYVGELSGFVAEGGGVECEALFAPVVGFGDAVPDGLFEEVERVGVVDCGTGVAAGVEHALCVGLVGGHGGGGGEVR